MAIITSITWFILLSSLQPNNKWINRTTSRTSHPNRDEFPAKKPPYKQRLRTPEGIP